MKDSSSSAPPASILNRGGGASDLVAAARAYGRLERAIHQALPEARVVRVACVRGTELVMAAATPVWATRGRMLATEILAAAAADWPEPLETVRIIVAPPLDAAQ